MNAPANTCGNEGCVVKIGTLILLSIRWVSFFEFLQYAYFYLTCISVLWYSSDDFDCHPFVRQSVNSFYNLAKGPLS